MNILFVCMGNICRSPAAEGIFKQLVEEAGLSGRITCDSAGTIGYHAGDRADSRMRAAASSRGYSLDSLSRRVRPADFDEFDHIIAMDRENMDVLQQLAGIHPGKARLSMMCDYATRHRESEVPDPYYGGGRGFDRVLDILEDACAGLLDKLSAQ